MKGPVPIVGHDPGSTHRTVQAMAPATDPTPAATALDGNLDQVSHGGIQGWARDPATPDLPVALLVTANGVEISRVVADLYRRDLQEAGMGHGCHGFKLRLPAGLATDTAQRIEVRCAQDGRLLPGSPAQLEPPAAGAMGPSARAADEQPAPLAAAALRGNLDHCDHRRVAGWAQDSAAAEDPVALLVLVNGLVIGRIIADRHRPDLHNAGLGSGRHGFDLALPHVLSVLETQEVRVVREADGAEITGSPMTLRSAPAFDDAAARTLDEILGRLCDDADETRALALLTQHAEQILERRARRRGG